MTAVIGSTTRLGLIMGKLFVVAIESRAVRTYDFIVIAHVQKDMRMIIGRARANALKFPRSDTDFFEALVIVKFWSTGMGHFEIPWKIKSASCVDWRLAYLPRV